MDGVRHLSVDLETYSSVSIGDCGLYKYVESPDFEILMLAYSFDFGEPNIVDLAAGGVIPIEVSMALFDRNVVCHAFNSSFEWQCLSKYYNLNRQQQLEWLEQWEDTMVHAYYLSYAGGLDLVGSAVGLPSDKQKSATGKALIRHFSCPVKPTKANGGRTRNFYYHDPDKWELFKDYCKQDVVAESNIYLKICGITPPTEFWCQWRTDLKINSRGVLMDIDLINSALAIDAEDRASQIDELKRLTGLDNPNSNVQLLGWIRAQGLELPDVTKSTVTDALKRDDLTPNVRRALELRREIGKTSVKKYNKMLDYRCADGRARGLLQFYGASTTGRYAGRGIQLQNLPRCYISDLDTARELVKTRNTSAVGLMYGSVSDTLSQLIRTAFIPSTDHIILDADFSAIEARVIAWLAGEEWVLEEFRGEGKIYEATASAMFHVPKHLIKKGTEYYKLRQQGKVAQLACSYSGGANALSAMDFNHEIPDEIKPELVKQWRQANPNIVRFWYKLEEACIDTIKTGAMHSVANGKITTALVMTGGTTYLQVRLPNGRCLHYCKPYMTTNRFGSESIGFYGKNQVTGKWGALETYSGKLAENVTQAVARDLLAESIERLESAGYEVLFHIHDEVVIDYKGDDPDRALDEVYSIMSYVPTWSEGLPLGADGWYGGFFKKD